MDIVSLITKKQNHKKLSEQEFLWFAKACLNKEIKDYQISAFLMSIYFAKLDKAETYYLTKAIVAHSHVMDYSALQTKYLIDKHSTGGVGDKVSLILLPILAKYGVKTAKISGRGLSFTGGTIDKLDAVKLKTKITPKKALQLLDKNNFFIMQQTADFVPVDRILYEIRDTSGTVNNLSLICASIMSKKIAVNAKYIYLDVKVGDGSMFANLKVAQEFAKLCIYVANRFKKKIRIHFTNMDAPLGKCLGNLIEVQEAYDFLQGKPPAVDLKNLIVQFVAEILLDLKIRKNLKQTIQEIEQDLKDQKMLPYFVNWMTFQNAELSLQTNQKFYRSKEQFVIKATKDGYVDYLSNKTFGFALIGLKAGRINKDSVIDFAAGIELHKKPNDFVKQGEPLITLHANDKIVSDVVHQIENNIIYQEEPKKLKPIILGLMKN